MDAPLRPHPAPDLDKAAAERTELFFFSSNFGTLQAISELSVWRPWARHISPRNAFAATPCRASLSWRYGQTLQNEEKAAKSSFESEIQERSEKPSSQRAANDTSLFSLR